MYADGNVMEGYPEITKDNWNGGIQIESQPNTEGYTENMRSYEPFAMPYIKITSAGVSNQIILTNGSIRGMKGKKTFYIVGLSTRPANKIAPVLFSFRT